MEIKDALKRIEKEIDKEEDLFGDSFGLTFESYSTYAIAVRLTEEFYKLTNLMSSDSEDATEKTLVSQLLNISKLCIKSATYIDVEEEEEEEEIIKKRTIGFRVADKEDGYTEEKEPKGYIDTYAIGFQVADEGDYYEEEEDDY